MSEGWKPDAYLGQTFEGRYRIDSCIGRGGMGAIYRAHDEQMDRFVAIKLVQKRHIEQEEIIKRFEREMRATTSIEHPHTIRVYEFGVSNDGELYLVMEYLDGTTLDRVIHKNGALETERLVRIARQVAGALSAAHGQGIIHRDLKPENIMVTKTQGEEDFIKVFDFGVARYTEEHRDKAKLTLGDHRVGTPLCMAPEYITKGKVGRRTDLYALGVVMYTMATGRAPFVGTPYEILHKHVKEAPKRPREHNEKVPEWLERVIMQLLAKQARNRQLDAAEVITQLDTQHCDFVREPPRPRLDGHSLPPPPALKKAVDAAVKRKHEASTDPSALAYSPDLEVALHEAATAVPKEPRTEGANSKTVALPFVPAPPKGPRKSRLPTWVIPVLLTVFIVLTTQVGAYLLISSAPTAQRAIQVPTVAIAQLEPIPRDTETRIIAETLSRRIGDGLLQQQGLLYTEQSSEVDATLTGSVRRIEDLVYLHVTLVGSDGGILWTEAYDLTLSDEVTQTTGMQIANEVRVNIR